VFSIEPNNYNVKLLYLSTRLNNFDNIIIYPFAASDRRGLMSYTSRMSNGSVYFVDGPKQVLDEDLVYTERLDAIVDSVDVLKIDVEGADYLAMKGASRLLASKPIVFAEFAPAALESVSNVPGEDYLRLFVDCGYDISVIPINGEVINCRKDINKIMKIYRDSMVDHIDLYITSS